MATAGPLREIDEKFLQCTICLEQLKKPKLLPCGHHYCRDCLVNISTETDVRCPICRETFTLPPNGVDGFTTDFNTNNIIEFVQSHRSDKGDTRESSNGCCDHSGETSDLCCVTCDSQPICSRCRVLAHESHEVKDTASLAESQRRMLTEKLASLMQRRELMYGRQEEINRKIEEITRISEEYNSVVERFGDLTATASSVLSSGNDWTHVQFITGVCSAIDQLIREVERGYPGLELRSDIAGQGSPVATSERGVRACIKPGPPERETSDRTVAAPKIAGQGSPVATPERGVRACMKPGPPERETSDRTVAAPSSASTFTCSPESIVKIKGGTEVIDDITACGDDSIIVIGGREFVQHITTIDIYGNKIRQDFLYSNAIYGIPCCDSVSSSKVAAACGGQIVIYDITNYTHCTKNLRDITRFWSANEKVSCFSIDSVVNHIYVRGAKSGDIYVFDKDWKYIRSLTLPWLAGASASMAVHRNNLLVCDVQSRKAFSDLIGQESVCQPEYEFAKPRCEWAELKPRNVCTDKAGSIYMLWSSRMSHNNPLNREYWNILVKYNRGDPQLQQARSLNCQHYIRCITTVEKHGIVKIVMVTSPTGKLVTVDSKVLVTVEL